MYQENETLIHTAAGIQDVFKELKNHLIQYDIAEEQFKLVENKTNWSVYYFTVLICTIKTTGNTKFIAFDAKHRDLFQNLEFQVSQIKSDQNHFRIHINTIADILSMKEQIFQILDSIQVPCTFDVCSRYNECSDQKKCVHPDQVHAKECGYKRKLDKGIIFYGKNRNID